MNFITYEFYRVAYKYDGCAVYRGVDFIYMSPSSAKRKAKNLLRSDGSIDSVMVEKVYGGLFSTIAKYERGLE